MTRLVIVALLAIVGTTGISGCTCVAPDHAMAQGGDAPRPSPITGVNCFSLAERRTGLTPSQQQRLCLGAPTPAAPVECFEAAVRELRITDDQAVLLCRCASSMEPVQCWQHARDQSRMVDDEIAALCSPTIALGLMANCRTAGY